MLNYPRMFEQRFFRIVFVGQVFLIGYEIVNAVVTQQAQVQAARMHLFFPVSLNEPFGSMDGTGNQVMKRQRLLSATKITLSF